MRFSQTAPAFRTALWASSLALLAACQSTSVDTFASPAEATAAMIRAAEVNNQDEARRIFDSFARSSVQRDKVYAAMFKAAEARYDSGNGAGAANILSFVTEEYPSATAAQEALVYSLFLERADLGTASEPLTARMGAAIDTVRAKSGGRSPWVDLAATQLAIDSGDLGQARQEFGLFLGTWDGSPAALGPYVEDIDRYLQSH